MADTTRNQGVYQTHVDRYECPASFQTVCHLADACSEGCLSEVRRKINGGVNI